MEDYIFQTEFPHVNNEQTMKYFLDNHIEEVFGVGAHTVAEEGTYCEIVNRAGLWAVHAMGNGDSFNHKITFEKLN